AVRRHIGVDQQLPRLAKALRQLVAGVGIPRHRVEIDLDLQIASYRLGQPAFSSATSRRATDGTCASRAHLDPSPKDTVNRARRNNPLAASSAPVTAARGHSATT